MTKQLLPLLQAAAKKGGVSTIVSVSSALHWETYPEGIRGVSIEALNDPEGYNKDLSYGQSKLANILFAQELAERVKKDNVLVNAIHPGKHNRVGRAFISCSPSYRSTRPCPYANARKVSGRH